MSIFDTSASATPTSITQQSVTPYAQPLAQQIVGQAQALGSKPMPQYTGELAAGPSDLQNQAFKGLANLTLPTGMATASTNLGNVATQAQNIGSTFTPTTFTNQNFNADSAQQYMNPYLKASLQPQLELLQNQLGQQNARTNAQLAQAGAYGGGRQAVENQQNALNSNLAANSLISSGYNTAYNNAMNQFNTDQARNLQTQQAQETANQYKANLGLQGLQSATTANQALGQNAQSQGQQSLANLNALAAQGQVEQQQQQAADTAAYNQYLLQLQYPQTMLTAQENAFKSVPNINQLTYGAMPSTFQNIGSLGGGLQSLLSAIGGNQPIGSGTSSTMAGLNTITSGLQKLLGGSSGTGNTQLDNMISAYNADNSGSYGD